MNCLLLLFLSFGNFTLAMPMNGDQTTHIVHEGARGEKDYSKDLRLTLTSFDNDLKGFAVEIKEYFGETSSNTSWGFIARDQLFTKESLTEFLKKCKENNGIREKIEVVAGIFDTCKIEETRRGMPTRTQTRWYGFSPIESVIKETITSDYSGSGGKIYYRTRELSAFSFGK